MNRKELDAFVEHHGLSTPAVEAALELSNALPAAEEIERFAVRLLQVAGVLSLAAGIVFFVAANWEALAVLGRFALVEGVLAGSVAVALWKPPPHAVGRYAFLLAFIVTGALLALVGQTYQTGADVYELFLTWALLGGVFAVAGWWSVTWAAWLLVLDAALSLFCGWRPETGWLWLVFGAWGLNPALLLLGPMVVNILLWLACGRLERTRCAPLAPPWLGRLALACAIGFGTSAGFFAIFGSDDADPFGPLTLPLLVVLLAGILAYALHRRRDVFPLAAVAGSTILLVSAAIVKSFGSGADEAAFFVTALWLIASSAVSGHVLMKLVRAWQPDKDEA